VATSHFIIRQKVEINNNNSAVLVRELIIQAEGPPLVGEVSANFSDIGMSRGQSDGSLGRILDFLDRSRYLFFQVAPQLYSRG
jgi:hypothetical protein